jgi:hypothetical protein
LCCIYLVHGQSSDGGMQHCTLPMPNNFYCKQITTNNICLNHIVFQHLLASSQHLWSEGGRVVYCFCKDQWIKHLISLLTTMLVTYVLHFLPRDVYLNFTKCQINSLQYVRSIQTLMLQRWNCLLNLCRSCANTIYSFAKMDFVNYSLTVHSIYLWTTVTITLFNLSEKGLQLFQEKQFANHSNAH